MNQPDPAEEAIFNAARQFTDPNKLRAYLDLACEGKPEMRLRIERLLGVSPEADDFFRRQAARPASLPHSVDAGATIIPAISEGPGTVIGRYKLLQKLGEGGCGIVHMAEQEEPVRRRVALKVIKLGMDTKQVVARFEAERQALALMDHPNIAKVLDAGATDTGRPYFVMELVRGIKITDYCDQNHLSTTERLDLFTKVCQAVQHAHQKGIIHRDLKPSNILVTLHDGVPVPKVIDFGIAKATQGKLTDQTLFTAFEQFIGTPAYMSPEQAEMSGLDIDTRSDIYSLGVLLYELLTGTTPFDAKELQQAGLDEMRRTIREKEPVRPSTRLSTMLEGEQTATARHRHTDAPKLINLLRGDLDWIVMKCLEKDRTRRYETANGLAMDLTRHLDNEPVVARPPSTAYRFQKLVRRNKLAFAAVGAICVALLLGTLVSLWQAVRASRAEELAQAEARKATLEATRARQAENVATEKSKLAEQQRQRAEASEREVRQNIYVQDMNAAFHALEEKNLGRAVRLLENYSRPAPNQEDFRSFEWRHLWKLCRSDELLSLYSHDGTATCAAFSTNGEWLATAGFDRVVKVWDVTAKRILTNLIGFKNPVVMNSLAFSPDGRTLAATDGDTIHIWETRQWQKVRSLQHGYLQWLHNPLAFSADGNTLAVWSPSNHVELWDTRKWEPKPLFSTEKLEGVTGLAFSPDDRALAAAAYGGLRVWDLVSQTDVEYLRGPSPNIVAFSPDGNFFAAGLWDGTVRLWRVGNTQEVGRVSARIGFGLAFSRDSKLLAIGSGDQVIALYEVPGLKQVSALRGHFDEVWALAFSPDNRLLASTCKDGTVKLWRATPATKPRDRIAATHGAWFSADSKTFATIDSDATIRWWDVATSEEKRSVKLPLDSKRIRSLEIGADGHTCAFGMEDGSVEVWNLETKEQMLLPLRGHDRIPWGLAFSADAKFLATSDSEAQQARYSGTVRLWSVTTGKEIFVFKNHSNPVAFSPRGNLLAIGALDCSIELWDVSAKKMLTTLVGHSWPGNGVTFSPDGKLAASGNHDNTARIWDAATGRELRVLKGHLAGVNSVAFSPDGKTIATGGIDNTARLWNAATGQELLTLQGFKSYDVRVAFSPDGTILAVTDDENEVRLFRAPSWAEIAAAQKVQANAQ